MMPTNRMAAAVGALKRATEDSRELDVDIGRAIGLAVARNGIDFIYEGMRTLPHYSLRIDDAVCLCPPGARWQCKQESDEHYRAVIHLGGAAFRGEAKTAALAICLACLRSRSAKA